jgi:hypothetical protein
MILEAAHRIHECTVCRENGVVYLFLPDKRATTAEEYAAIQAYAIVLQTEYDKNQADTAASLAKERLIRELTVTVNGDEFKVNDESLGRIKSVLEIRNELQKLPDNEIRQIFKIPAQDPVDSDKIGGSTRWKLANGTQKDIKLSVLRTVHSKGILALSKIVLKTTE